MYNNVWIEIHSLLRLIDTRGSADVICLFHAYRSFAAHAQ